jgi:hypothetical protein
MAKRKLIEGAEVVLKTYRSGPRYTVLAGEMAPEEQQKEFGYVLKWKGVPTKRVLKLRQNDTGDISIGHAGRYTTVTRP